MKEGQEYQEGELQEKRSTKNGRGAYGRRIRLREAVDDTSPHMEERGEVEKE